MTLSPLPFLFAGLGMGGDFPEVWRMAVALVAGLCCFGCALSLFRNPRLGKIMGGMGGAACLLAAMPFLIDHPAWALLGIVALIAMGFTLYDFQLRLDKSFVSSHLKRCRQRAGWACLSVPLAVVCWMILPGGNSLFFRLIPLGSSLIAQALFVHWIYVRGNKQLFLYPLAALFLAVSTTAVIFGYGEAVLPLIGLITLLILPPDRTLPQRWEHGWEVLLNHPARILLSSFSALSLLGTLLLLTPSAAAKSPLGIIDAAFTAVSAVCVTGLVTLDTPMDFSLTGQCFILLLIQLGGLGIMSIGTVALHALGRRLSLQHERILGSMTDTDHQDLMASLITILQFTLIIETLGAMLLSALFHAAGDELGQAAWRGLFTSISAFCNAGFALQSQSLIPYQNNPLVLHITGALIILGGMAPATSLIIPKWLRGKPIPEAARIALLTTVVLLIGGTGFILAFEWNGILAGLPLPDKLHNGWFQSVTLRTAGFNSVDLSTITDPTLLIMLFLMFIGGSPGGTAGGVKTTTIGILALTFWADISNRREVIIGQRKVRSTTIKRAITIIGAGGAVWFLIILMLETTQQIPARDLVFEATSALGTAGLTIGATPLLDEMGKIIIMIAMFAGRVGPMTLFMLLGTERSASRSRCLDAKISLS